LGPFGAFFMMPPGSPEQDSPDDMRTGLLEPPRFRDELMFVRDQDGVPITADSTILADLEPQPPDDDPPPASGLPPPEPPFMEEPPEAPAEDPPPAPPAFPMFSVQAPYPEAEAETDPGPDYGEASPLPPDPAPPPLHPHFDAAARIVAEANATAAALENLERMLEQQLPYAHAAPPAYSPDPFVERPHPATPLADGLRLRLQGLEAEPAPASPFPAPLFPLPTRPPRSRRSVYLVGFLTGLVISLLTGAVLLFFILYGRPG
jgi:hypothetical protein